MSDASADGPAEKEWWDDPGMPWRRKPERADLWCLGWIGFIGIFGLVMLPLRGWLLGLDVPLLFMLTGSRTAAAGMGSLVRVGEYGPWLLAMIPATLMSIKFDWVYWWAGKLWGRGMIEIWAGRSARAAKNYARVERWAKRWGALGIFIAYVPIPLPIMPVVFVLAGASGMRLRRFLVLDTLASLAWSFLHFGLGYLIGEPAVEVLRQYARVANWVAIALLVFIIGSLFLRKKDAPTTTRAAATGDETVD